jgi:NADH dehydrogenase FAD-containing subunit
MSPSLPPAIQVSLLTKGTTVLPSHPAKAQEIFIRIFKERGIDLHTQAEAASVKEGKDSGGERGGRG